MSDVENRVVEMKFNNSKFESAVATTMNTLDKLKQKLNFDGAKKGLDDLNNSSKNFSINDIGKNVDDISGKFRALSVVGVTALATIANQAVHAGESLIQNLKLGAIKDGFADYNTKLTSVQTIMNATGKSLGVVNGHFNELDTYADKTIYNLTDMTSALAKFTNAGVDLPTSVKAIKGIANATALAGQGTDAAQIAFYNLSQSISGGFLTTTDYKSLNLANIATKEFKTNLLNGAVAAKTLTKDSKGLYHIPGAKGAYTAAQIFSEQLSKGVISTQVLTKVLGDYGDASTAIGKKSLAAAQDVKGLPQLFDTLKESVGTQWTTSFEYILGNVKESTHSFTGLSKVLGKYVSASGTSRNANLKLWKSMNGRTDLIDGIQYAFRALQAVLKPIHDAYRELFPAKTGKDLFNLTIKFRAFAKGLIISKSTGELLHRTFKGLFAILKIGELIFKGVIKVFFSFFKLAGVAGPGVLTLTAALGDFFVALLKFLTTTNAIGKFFNIFLVVHQKILAPFLHIVVLIAEAFAKLAHGDVKGFVSGLGDAFNGLRDVIIGIRDHFLDLANILAGGFVLAAKYLLQFSKSAASQGNVVVQFLGRMAAAVGTFLGGFGLEGIKKFDGFVKHIADGMLNVHKDIKMGGSFSEFNAGLDGSSKKVTGFTGAGVLLKTVIDKIKGGFTGLGNGLEPITKKIGDFFAGLGDLIQRGISNINYDDVIATVNTGVVIAIYIAVKNFLKSVGGLADSLSGVVNNIGAIFGQLKDSLKALQQNIKATILLKIAVAIALLVASIVLLYNLDPKKLGIALGALTVLFLQLGITMGAFSKFGVLNVGKFTSAGTFLVLMAVAIRLLAGAVKQLGEYKPKVLIQGLLAVSTLLTGLALFTRIADVSAGGASAGVGLLLLAVAIRILVKAVGELGAMKPAVLAKGLGSITLILAALAAFSIALGYGVGLVGAAIGLAILSVTLLAFAHTIDVYNNINADTFKKGMGFIAIALGLLAVALYLMPPDLPALAAGLIIIAVALKILSGVIDKLGSMDWKVLALGLGVIIASLAIFAGFGLLAPLIGALGAAMLLLGGALILAGVAFAVFAGGFAIFAAVGAAGVAVALAAFEGILALLPLFAQQLGYAMVTFAKAIGDGAPKLLEALGKVLEALLQQIDQHAPHLIETTGNLIILMANKLVELGPRLFQAGLDLILGFLKVIRDNINPIADIAVDLISSFITAIARNIGRLVQSGIDLIIGFINAMADGIRNNTDKFYDAMGNLGGAIIDGMVEGIKRGGHLIKDALLNLVPAYIRGPLSKVLGIFSPSRVFAEMGMYLMMGMANGISDNAGRVGTQIDRLGGNIVGGMTTALKGASDAAVDMVDIQPTITPVIDLTRFKKDAAGMNAALPKPIISGETSYAQALSFATDKRAADEAAAAAAGAQSGPSKTEVTLTQNNYSPKALSADEIYRANKSLVARAKEALNA